MLAQALQEPMRDLQEIVFCTRVRYDDPHWYANIGYYCDDANHKAYPGNGQPDAGQLLKWNPRTGETKVLVDAKGGSVRDPQVHYDARRILFSMRPDKTDFFHLYEINVDGTGLRQLTTGEFDDYEPTYLPDGGIAFVTTRCKRWVNCWMTQVGVIYRCDGDGKNMECISANTEHDNTPWVLPDGRILYTRWEYVDRSQVEFHHLWAMNPDGSGAMIYYGNMHPNIVMIDAKPVPGADNLVVASFSPGHGINEHAGIATLVTSQQGPDDRTAAQTLLKGKHVRDPFPLATNCFLAALNNQVVLFDGSGKMEVIYQHPGNAAVNEPRPILPRPRERLIPRRTNPAETTGRMVLADVYNGRNLPGVKRGDIKKLLVLESLPKEVNFSGGPDLVSWLGTFTLERVVGTVPVEEDGSAFFEVPANRQLFFVALDKDDLSVKRMQSFTDAMPGETMSCVGCHEPRAKTPENRYHGTLQALQRPASKIAAFEGYPDVLDFHRDIQPILDRLCVPCHNYEKREGKLILAGDLGPMYAHSFFSLFAYRLVADGRNGYGNQPPRSIGSSASRLLELAKKHQATPREWRTLWLWIESGAAYAGSYAGLRNTVDQGLEDRAVNRVFRESGAVLQRRCFSCHTGKSGGAEGLPLDVEARWKTRPKMSRPTAAYERIVLENDPIARYSTSILLNFSEPRHSPLLLGPLAKSAGGLGSCGAVFKDTKDPDYLLLLAAVEKGKTEFTSGPRYGTPGFQPNHQYVRELKRYGILPQEYDLKSSPLDYFAADQKYWQSLWHQPAKAAAK
jgi:hypothetical protein